MVPKILNNLDGIESELKKLQEKYDKLADSHKELQSSVKKTSQEYVDYYYKTNGALDTLMRRNSRVKQSFKEVTEALEEQKVHLAASNEYLTELSKEYGAPVEKIQKVIDLLKKKAELEANIGELDKNNKKHQAYLGQLNDELTKLEERIEKNQLAKSLQDDVSGSVNKAVQAQQELEESVKRTNNAQENLNSNIEKTKEKYRALKESGLGDIVKGLVDGAKAIFSVGYDKYTEVDQATHDFGRQMGMSAKELGEYSKSTLNSYGEMAAKLGMEFKDIYKFQTMYAESTEKSILLSMDQMGSMAALSRNVGDEAISVAGKNLDVFATSADATIDYLAKGSARAALEGLNVKKYSDAFANNIKMASKYTFKEGITGIQKMTLLSQRLKFNMESIGTAMDKFSTIEGAIEASAKIQVLGGQFAANFGNPLEAMSQALLDGEAFTKRIIDTVASQARFDRKTGEINLSPIDKQRLKAYADALGMSFDEVFNMSTQTRKSQEIYRAVGGKFGKDSDELAFLSNKAQFDKEQGYWYVLDENGDKQNIANLDKGQLEILRDQAKHEEAINSNVYQIKKKLVDDAKGEMSEGEIVTAKIESEKARFARMYDAFPEEVKEGVRNLKMLENLSLLGPIQNILSGIIGLFAGGGLSGIIRAFRGTSSSGGMFGGGGAKGKYTGGPWSKGMKGYRAARTAGVPKWLLRTGKFGKKIPGVGTVLTVGLGAYEAAEAHSNYNASKDEIMMSNSSNMEKAQALNAAKRERNKGYGTGIGGAAGGIAGGVIGTIAASMATGALAGSVAPGIGNIIGGIVGLGIGLATAAGGAWLGGKIGENSTESVSDTLNEITNGQTNPSDSVTGNNGVLQEVQHIRAYAYGINSKLDSIYNVLTLKADPTKGGNINGVKVKNSNNISTISVSDMKVNVSGQVKLVADNTQNNIDITKLINNPDFKREIIDVVTKAIHDTPSGKQNGQK